MSFGEPEVTRAWVEKERFPFEIWTDTDQTLATALGAADAETKYPKRITVVLDRDANVVLRYDEVAAGAHPEQVLEDVRARFSGP